MALVNIPSELELAGVNRRVVVKVGLNATMPAPTVTVTPRTSISAARTDLTSADWGWEQLRDYVIAQMEKVKGAFPRNPVTEKSIFAAFIGRYGAQNAQRIARYAFEVEKGRWGGALISVNRFCKNSDPYFGDVILQRLDGNW